MNEKNEVLESVDALTQTMEQGALHEVEVGDDSPLAMSEDDLDELAQGTQNLLREGALTEKQAADDLQQIEKVRKSFRDYSPDAKKKIINRRVGYGKTMFESSLPGDVAQVLDMVLENGVLKNRFCQFVPFFDRAEVNLQIFGERFLGKKNSDDRLRGLQTMAETFFKDAKKARKEAEILVEQHKAKKDEEEEVYFSPSIPTPALKTSIHIHSVSSMYHVRAYQELDKLLLLIEWLKWNDCISANEQKTFLKPLLDQAMTLGRRGYFTFTELMRLRAESKKPSVQEQTLAA